MLAGMAITVAVVRLMRQSGAIVDRTIEITPLDLGVQAYAFTFG